MGWGESERGSVLRRFLSRGGGCEFNGHREREESLQGMVGVEE